MLSLYWNNYKITLTSNWVNHNLKYYKYYIIKNMQNTILTYYNEQTTK